MMSVAPDQSIFNKVVRYKQYLLVAILGGIGAVLFVRSKNPQLASSTAEDWREAAFALLATALAMFIAEFVRKGYEDLLSREVTKTIEENLQDMRQLKGLLTDAKRLRDTDTAEAVSEVLSVKLGTGDDSPLTKSLSTMLDGMSDLGESNHWAKDIYREYISDVLQNASENTSSLCKLSANTNPAPFVVINLVSRAQRTDEILQKLMARMQRGCKYLVVSDVQSWLDDKLEKFFEESRSAARRGVLIRRIFVVKEGDLRAGLLTPDRVAGELRRHLGAQSTKPNGYHIRLYGPSTKLALSKQKLDLLTDHVGMFIPERDQPCISVTVEKTNLSRLKIANESRAAPTIRDFGAIWDALGGDLTDTVLTKAESEWNALRANAQRLRSPEAKNYYQPDE